MKSRVILVLVVLAVVYSIVGIVSDVGIKQITGAASQNLTDFPFTFGFIVIILLILIIFLVIIDLISSKKLF